MADTPIIKRLHISGLTPALTPNDLSTRLSTFGIVKSVDGFGLQDGLGQPRKFGYVTLETTTGKLARCLNLLSGSTWKGAKLRIGEAKLDFAERLAKERQAAIDEPPRKKRKRSGGVQAEDMSLVTPENVVGRGGWKVTPLGRIVRPVRMRPDHPLPPVDEDKNRKAKVKPPKKRDVDAKDEEKKKKKRAKDPDVRARRRTIDVTRWPSVHLKGMFLDMEVLGTKQDGSVGEVAGFPVESDGSESESEDEEMIVEETVEAATPVVATRSPAPPISIPISSAPIPAVSTLPENNTDIELEKNQSLNLLASLFGSKKDTDWVGRESVGSDIDEEELTKGQGMMVDHDNDDEFETVPMDAAHVASPETDESDPEMEVEVQPASPLPPPTQKQQQVTKLKDLFAPREEDAGFSLLGHLDLDIELDDEVPFSTSIVPQIAYPEPDYTPSFVVPAAQAPSHTTIPQLNPRQALFFPLPPTSGPSTKARPKDLFDVAKENGWSWRDPSVGFFRSGTEEDIRAQWESEKVELTREWKRRWREAGKVNRRRRGGGGGDGGE